jgi:hypothetical protein
MAVSLPVFTLPPARSNRERAAELLGRTIAAPTAAQTVATAVAAAVQEGVAVVAPYSSQGARFEADVEIEHVALDGTRTTARARLA